jgi:hypothetical protein
MSLMKSEAKPLEGAASAAFIDRLWHRSAQPSCTVRESTPFTLPSPRGFRFRLLRQAIFRLSCHQISTSECRVWNHSGQEGTADGLKPPHINLSCILSTCCDQDVLSVYAENDESDFARFSVKGKVSRIAAGCGHQVIAFDSRHVSTAPRTRKREPCTKSLSPELFTGRPASAIGFGSLDLLRNRGFVLDQRHSQSG